MKTINKTKIQKYFKCKYCVMLESVKNYNEYIMP